MEVLFLVCLFWFIWWLLVGYFPNRRLFYKPVNEMSDRALEAAEREWRKGYAFQDHGAMYGVKRRYLRPGTDKSEIIAAHKRLLAIQEELLRRQKPSSEAWQVDYVKDLERRILMTREALRIYDKQDISTVPELATENPVAKPISPVNTSKAGSSLDQLLAVSAKQTVKKKPLKKSTKTLFLESLEGYLIGTGGSDALVFAIKELIRHPKMLPDLSNSRKRNLIKKLEGYRMYASREELQLFGEILNGLLKKLEVNEKLDD